MARTTAADALGQHLAERVVQMSEGLRPSQNANGIQGVGVDAEVVARFTSPPLAAYSDDEIEYCRGRQRPEEAFAGTWCVKEATVKALGGCVPGAEVSVGLRHVLVSHDSSGALQVEVDIPMGAADPSSPPLRVLGSVTYVDGIALAVVITCR